MSWYYSSHFRDKEIEAQRGEVTYLIQGRASIWVQASSLSITQLCEVGMLGKRNTENESEVWENQEL